MNKLIPCTLMCLGLISLIPLASAAGDAQAGEKLVATCAACHGNDGNGLGPSFPKLSSLGENYLYKQMKDIANKDPKKSTRKVVEMTGMLDNFSDKDLRDIAAYYNSQALQLAGARPIKLQLNSGLVIGDSAEALAYGEKVYRAGNAETGVAACTACHSPTGKGNSPAGYPRVAGQYAEYIEKQLLAFQTGDRSNDDASIMRDIAGKMSAAEIKAVANYISGLQD